MSYKPTPITARISKTTKGGITQPILNMGAAVGKMKIKSPAQRRQTKAEIAGEAGRAADDLARKNKTGQYNQARIDGEAGWAADDSARKNKTGQYTKITGKIGSDLRRQQYKDKGWAMDATTMKPKAKVANTTKAKGVVGKDVTTANIGRAAGSTEALKSKPVEKKAPKLAAKRAPKKAEPSKGDVRKANRKLDSADRKDSRASRVSQKAKDARASGNTAKADRLDRRVGRIKKRANKKRGQAAGAIEVK